MTAAMIDDEETTDRSLAVLDTVREQLSAIEAALPDYGPSFSALEQQTQQIKAQLDRIAASPSVKLSGDQHASRSAQALSDILSPSLARLQSAIDGAEHRQSELGRLMDTIHVRSMNRPYPALLPAIALVVGFCLYPIIAATAPGGTNLAALATGHRDRWSAGGELMNAANSDSWASIVRASLILADNREVIGRCNQNANASARAQACTIIVAPKQSD